MKPYYSDDAVTVYLGDCAVIAPQLGRFDLLCTDPPYGIGEAAGKNKSRSKLARSRDYGDLEWDDAPPSQALIDQLRGQCTDAVIFGGNYFALPPSSCWLVWDKDNGESDFADCELAWTSYKKAVRRKRHRWAGMLQENMGAKEERTHPTQKPLPVMTWAIAQCPSKVLTVFDPFAGSGTTLLAARIPRMRAVGIEREKAYCDAIVDRLRQGVLSL